MRLPASVLGTLRVGLGATALITGCEAAQPQALVLEPGISLGVEAEPGLGEEVANLVEQAIEQAGPVIVAANPAVGELVESRPRIRKRLREAKGLLEWSADPCPACGRG